MRDHPRLNRLFAPTASVSTWRSTTDSSTSPFPGGDRETCPRPSRRSSDAAPDAIQLTVGQARHLQDVPGKQKPSLVLRTDVANVYGRRCRRALQRADRRAGRAGPAAGRRLRGGQPLPAPGPARARPPLHREHHRAEAAVRALRHAADDRAAGDAAQQQAGGYMVDGDLNKIRALVRQAVELGADIIKADPCDDATEYHKVIETAGGVPVLVRGGGRAADDEILRRTAEVMHQGAAGIVYGRNVVQHANPRGMTQALMAVVHAARRPTRRWPCCGR